MASRPRSRCPPEPRKSKSSLQSDGEVQVSKRIGGPQTDDFRKLVLCFLNFPQERQFNAQKITRFPKRGAQPNGLPQTHQRFRALIVGRQRIGKVEMNRGIVWL